MKNKKVKRIAALLLAGILLTGCALPPEEKNTTQNISEAKETVTLGEVADFFINAAIGYQSKAGRAEVLEGFKESEKATKLQMFVIAGRAFGSLPAAEGNAKKMSPPPVELSGVPDWAKETLQNLSDGGILAASDLGLPEKTDFSGETDGTDSSTGEENTETKSDMDGTVTMKDARILAARFFARYGTSLKDDFYAAVNKTELASLEIPEGDGTAGGSSEVTAKTEQQLAGLIMEIVNNGSDYTQGSPEQKIRDLYLSFQELGARSQAGIQPIQKYLDAVDGAQNFSELNLAVSNAVKELGTSVNVLFPGIPVTDTQDSTRKVLQLLTLTPGLASEEYDNPDGEAYREYRGGIVKQLLATGESQEEAERHADGLMKLEQDLASNMEVQDNTGEIKKQIYYTPGRLDEMMPQAKPSELLTATGLKPEVEMLVFDDTQFEAYSKWFTEENLELFKALEKMTILSAMSSCLSPELAEQFGYNMVSSPEEAVQNYLSEELGQIFVSRYFPSEAKEEIEKMVNMMVETFKARIEKLEWMEEATKKEAVKKLDSLNVLIGYPDEWQQNTAVIKSIADGGSYFDNITALEVARWESQLEELEKPVDPRKFSLAAYTVNAAASRTSNTIIFPAGILQAPFYDKNASFEQNLGSIGSTIAHEITHMFDDGGAQFDAQGNVKDWWQDSDYSHFKTLCKKAEECFDGKEAVPGAAANGKETLSENISDIGGIACGLEILSKMENPDYDAFFRSYANQWVRAGSYTTLCDLTESDIHSPNNLRCNLVLANFQEFYDTYDIKPGDGMYVAPEDRIQIW